MAPDGLPALFGVLRFAALGVIYAHGAWLAKCKPGCARPDPVLLEKTKFRCPVAVMIKREQGGYFDPGLIPFY